MINNLIEFKEDLDTVLRVCFHDDEHFAYVLKESFEYFVNTRKNKPAEMISKFLDARLKATSKVNIIIHTCIKHSPPLLSFFFLKNNNRNKPKHLVKVQHRPLTMSWSFFVIFKVNI